MDKSIDLTNVTLESHDFTQSESLAEYINANESHDRAALALNVIFRFGSIDGAHHKTWVLDQVTRLLTGEKYEEFVDMSRGDTDEDGERDYEWDEGIAP